MEDEYTIDEFDKVCSLVGEYTECIEYIDKNGGTLYTQVDSGIDDSVVYVKGDRLVNRTGVYGVA